MGATCVTVLPVPVTTEATKTSATGTAETISTFAMGRPVSSM
jgi:hypothetical protein